MRMEQILKEISIHEDIRAALLGGKNKLSEVFDLVIDYDEGTWEKFIADASPRKSFRTSTCSRWIGPAASSPATTSRTLRSDKSF